MQMLKKILWAAVLVSTPLPAFSETIQIEPNSLIQRFDRIERRLMALEKKLFSASTNQAVIQAGTGLGDYEIRLQELETESTSLYGGVEQIGNSVEILATKIEKMAEDIEMRLQDIERLSLENIAKQPLENKPKDPPAISKEQVKDIPKLTVPEGLDPQKHYQKAYEFLTAASYREAQRWLEEFLLRHKDHTLADNAYYWLGEVFLIQDNPKKAVKSFRNGLEAFPEGAKAPGNLLKMGIAFQKMGQKKFAKSAWEKLRTDFPDSVEAEKAQKKLKEL